MSQQSAEIAPGSALESLVQGIRASIEHASTLSQLLRQVSALTQAALRDSELLPGERWAYRDPDDLFLIHAGVVEPMSQTGPHDHGHHWVIYGVCRGALETIRYERQDDGSDGEHAELRPISQFVCKAGEVDVIEPWGIHDQHNTTQEPVLNFVVRGSPGPRYLRNRFDLEAKQVIRVGGRGD